jgi:ABC-type uncharacterized transport system substrate-binding protein
LAGGRNLRLVFRASPGTNEALPALAADLIAQNVDLIFAAGDHATIAAQRATTQIPIVGVCDDMVGSHLVDSMARPGGNTTGISILASELDVKRLQLLHELVPQAARIGILADPTTISTRPQLEAAAPALGIALITTLAEELIRRGVAEAEGALFRAMVSEAVRWTIDSAKVKTEMGAAWWNARCRQSLVTTVAVKARTDSTKLAA